MKRALLIASLFAPICVRAQGTYPACPGGVLFQFQLDVQARFLADSTLTVEPTPVVRNPRNLVQFVVDTLGVIVPASFHVIKVTDHTLVQDAKQMSERWRYRPAQSGGRPVCQLVQTPIDFTAPHS